MPDVMPDEVDDKNPAISDSDIDSFTSQQPDDEQARSVFCHAGKHNSTVTLYNTPVGKTCGPAIPPPSRIASQAVTRRPPCSSPEPPRENRCSDDGGKTFTDGGQLPVGSS